MTALCQEKCGIVGYVHEFIELLGPESIPVTGYEATLITDTDTLSVISKNGDFQFRDLQPGKVTLLIEKAGYIPFVETITLTEGDQAITIELFHEGEALEESVVTAAQPIITMKGDTLIFHANAVKRMAGDFAIDLIAQMPGAELTGAGITVGGKLVSKAYVNGVLVFGRDPMDAMRNLAAEEVITMNIYDEAPIEENISNPQKQRVINIHTKNPIVEVTDIQSLFSGGADKQKTIDGNIQKRYLAGISGNFFSENLQIKTDVLSNNIGIDQSFLLGTDPFSTPASAITTQTVKNSAQIKVEKYWGRNYKTRTGLKFGYSFTDNYSKNPQRSIIEHFKTDLTPSRMISESMTNISTGRAHNIDGGFQKSFGRIRLTWNSSIQFQEDGYSSDTDRESVINGKSYKENRRSRTDNDSWKIDQKLSFSGSTKKNNDHYFLNLAFTADKGNTTGFTVDTLKSSTSRRYLDISGDKMNWNASANFNYSRSIKSGRHQEMLVFDLLSEYSSDSKRQTSLDMLGKYPSIDDFNTYDFTYKVFTNKAGINFRRVYFNGGLSLQHAQLLDTERIPGEGQNVSKTYLSVIPYIYYYNGKTLDISLRSTIQLPSLEQIRERIDNTSQYSVLAGNPSIKPSQSYSLSFSKRKDRSLISVLLVNAVLTEHPIVRRERIFQSATVLPEYNGYVMPAGSMLHTYDNADWALKANISKSNAITVDMGQKLNIQPIVFNYTVGTGADINPAYMIEQLYRTRNLSANANVRMNYTLSEKIRLQMDGGTSYNNNSSTISDDKINLMNWNYDITVKYNPWEFVFVESSYNNTSRRILKDGKAHSNSFLKMSVGTKLFAQRLTIFVEGIDLLKNSSIFSTTYTENSISQTFNPVFGQYFLLSIKYRFNSSQSRSFRSSFNNVGNGDNLFH